MSRYIISCRHAAILLTAFLCCAFMYSASAETGELVVAESEILSENEWRWYFFHGSSNVHPRLKKADREVDRQLNQPFRLIAPGFDDVRTFSDHADKFLIWSPFMGVGRRLGDNWSLWFQAGGSAGKVITRSTDISVLLLPWRSDVEIHRSNIFVGPGLSWYPFGFPQNVPDMDWRERFNNARPYLSATLMWNRLTYKASVRAGFKPFGNFVQVRERESYHTLSNSLGAGVDLPLTRNTSFTFSAQYSFMHHYGQDFDGLNFSFMFKRVLGRSRS